MRSWWPPRRVVSRVADSGSSSYGKWIVVDHGDGWQSLHAHLKAQWVRTGQVVDQGMALGLVGESGGVSGAHLHFEEKYDGDVVRPSFSGTTFTFGTTLASGNCPDVPLAGDWDGDRTDQVAVFRRTPSGSFLLAGTDGSVGTVTFGRGSDPGDRRLGRRPGHRGGRTAPARPRVLPPQGRRHQHPRQDRPDHRPARHRRLGRQRHHRRRRLAPRGARVPAAARRRHAAGGAPRHGRLHSCDGGLDGNGVTDLGVFDAATATFTLRTVAGGTASTSTVALGTATDLPVTGDWNGDGVTDLGVWTPATATPRCGPRRRRDCAGPGSPPSSSASRADLACPLDTGCQARGSTALEAFGGHAPALPARRHDEDGHDLPAERLAGQPRGLADQGVYYPVAPGSPAQRFAVWDFLGRQPRGADDGRTAASGPR